MRNSSKIALTPAATIYSNATDTLVHIPFHGGGAAALNLAGSNAITRGYPTKITLGSTPSPLPTPGTFVKLNSVTPSAYNGYHKVLMASAADVWLDLDSSAMVDWTSGGNMSFNVIYDRFGNLLPQDIAGTITGLWANKVDGMTAHGSGSNTALIGAANASAFDLTGFRGILVVGFRQYKSAVPAAGDEYIFSLGRKVNTGAYSASGTVALLLPSGSNQAQLYFRPRTSADGGGTQTGPVQSSSMGTTAKRRACWLLDLRSTSSAAIYAYLDGVIFNSASIDLTNLVDWPSAVNGVAFGANITAALALDQLYGAQATGARISDFWWWKSSKSMVQVQRAIIKWSQMGELPLEVV